MTEPHMKEEENLPGHVRTATKPVIGAEIVDTSKMREIAEKRIDLCRHLRNNTKGVSRKRCETS